MVVDGARQNTANVLRVDHDHVVEALSPYRAPNEMPWKSNDGAVRSVERRAWGLAGGDLRMVPSLLADAAGQ